MENFECASIIEYWIKNFQKDRFPLSFINTILDDETNHELYTFMHGYSKYNQVSIVLENYHNTAFTTLLSPHLRAHSYV